MDPNDDLERLLEGLDDRDLNNSNLDSLDEAGVDLAEIARSLYPPGADDSIGFNDDGMLVAAEPELPDYGALEVVTARHAVHQVLPDADGTNEYIVSNLKKFDVEVHLLVKGTESFSSRQLRLKATLVYENSMPVRCSEGEALLSGDTAKTTVNGVATFKLQLGKRALSMHHDRQKFRVRIEPEDPELASAYPCLVCLNEPVKARDLERERHEREALMAIMQQQKAQIDQMAQNNALVMAELERFRRSEAASGSGS